MSQPEPLLRRSGYIPGQRGFEVPGGWTWKDAECPNCQTPRTWEMWSYLGGESRGLWRCPTCEPEASR